MTRQPASQTLNAALAATALRAMHRIQGCPARCAMFFLGGIWLAGIASDGMPAMCTIFVASLVSSTAGFAFSGLCGAALFHLVPSPGRAVEIMLVCSLANQAMMTWSMRTHIDWQTVARYAAGGVFGVLAGIVLGRAMASSTYVLLAGCFLICYGTYTLIVRIPRLPELPPAFDTVVGLLSGFFGGILAFPSVLVVIWTGCKQLDRQAQRAIYQPFILLMQFVAISALLIAAQIRPGSSHFVVSDLLYMPVALLGTSIGLRLFSRATEGQFKALVSALLIVQARRCCSDRAALTQAREFAMPKIDQATVPERTGSGYPPPFDAPCAGRVRRRLGQAGGLTDFGVNLMRLPPGGWSSQRHWHSHEDEFVHVLAGDLVLVEDGGETMLRAGDSAAFPKNSGDGHHMINRGTVTAVYLEVGSRSALDLITCADVDMMSPAADGRFLHKDGTPYKR